MNYLSSEAPILLLLLSQLITVYTDQFCIRLFNFYTFSFLVVWLFFSLFFAFICDMFLRIQLGTISNYSSSSSAIHFRSFGNFSVLLLLPPTKGPTAKRGFQTTDMPLIG